MGKRTKSFVSQRRDYSVDNNAVADGRVGTHKPRRNYWGNIHEEDIYTEEISEPLYYDYADYDEEDDHDSYYDREEYD